MANTRGKNRSTSTPDPTPPTVVQLSGSEGYLQEEAAMNAPQTLAERIRVAECRRDELLAQRRLRAIEDEITRLEREEQATTPTLSENRDIEVEITNTRKRSAPTTLESAHTKRTIRPKEPSEYKGKTLKEHREFFRTCKTAFRLDPQDFPEDRQKILWAMQYLGGDPRESWYSYFEKREETHADTPTWEYFKQFMLDLLSDPVNRSLEAATAHAQAIQRKDQSVRAFATYLEVLEDQLTPYTEEQRVQHLFSKLRPELQRAFTNYHQIPNTREELIAISSTLERNMRRAPVAQETLPKSVTRGKSKDRKEEKKSSTTAHTPESKPKDKSSVTCYKCQKKGHYANECKSSNPNHIPIRVQQTGKGQAS